MEGPADKLGKSKLELLLYEHIANADVVRITQSPDKKHILVRQVTTAD